MLNKISRVILQRPNKTLNKIAAEVTPTEFGTKELSVLIDTMFQVMREKSGAGLAAPQIGVSKRIFVYGFETNPRYPEQPPLEYTYLINPKIVQSDPELVDYEEGCLSVPGYRGIVSRPATVIVHAYDMLGKPVQISAKQFEARVIQHEMDHLDGMLFPDRASKLRKL